MVTGLADAPVTTVTEGTQAPFWPFCPFCPAFSRKFARVWSALSRLDAVQPDPFAGGRSAAW
jgi:hypothetical protein